MTADRTGILEALGLAGHRCVHLIGGGGKTAVLYALAHALAAEGRRVVTTTTTHILVPNAGESGKLVLAPDAARLLPRLREALATHRHVTAAVARLDREDKLQGLAPEELDALVDSGLVPHVLAEADGSRQLPIKAHLPHDPVLASRADLVIAVVGLSCLGAPVDDAHVHRAPVFRERLALPPDARVTPEVVVRILLHPEGYFGRVPAATETVVFLNQAENAADLQAGRDLSRRLRAEDASGRVSRVVVGNVRTHAFEVLPA